MRRQKRNMNDRAYQKGYHAGLVGRPMDNCPHSAEEARQYWLSGWREGRSDNRAGFTGISGMHREQQQ
jgi:ribosome modulation factor